MNLPNDVVVRSGKIPGPSVAVFCGVHGNERAGIEAVRRLVQEMTIDAGVVYFVYANPPAIKNDVRLVGANLNRLFLRNQKSPTIFEECRAIELMDLLDQCDALLDLHSYRASIHPELAPPFAICEQQDVQIAARFDVPYVISGFTAIQEGGSDGYMATRGKIGICVELGAIERTEYFVDLGIATVKSFLSSVGCIRTEHTRVQKEQKRFLLKTMYKKQNNDFCFTRAFRSFDRVRAGEQVATENQTPIIAKQDSIILFPRADAQLGVEAFLLAEEVE